MSFQPRGDHARQEGDDAVDDPADIDAHDPVPVVIGRIFDQPPDPDAGVVDQHLHRPERSLRLVGRAHKRRAIGDVEFDRVNLAALQQAHGVVQVILPTPGEGDLHALFGQHLHDAQADSARPAGHERDLILQVLHARTAAI